MADEIVFAQDAAPYTDPGAQGQTKLGNENGHPVVAPDEVAPGTPPGNPWGDENKIGERGTSTRPEDQTQAWRDTFHTETRETP